ncbi:Na+/H+ antiporter [Nannocystis bainbridge]|uniref:Na+/H+ antiporter n=1 Tax=Nannocystis bainbridge TaxID=2995303 RepID=A0ABT5EB86_9BACT|nr:Na+/H+ antiporter [Nannocystis bainbridge]MDC0723117.1 Na+/H+ antiporter [Nannocystis bainbridge]
MLHHELLLVLSLLFAIGVLHVLSGRLGISYPILLVLGGLGISLVPGAPHVSLDPELVFLVFLPPLLYQAAWFTPWREFVRLRGPIALQAFGLVLFTATAVALVAHALVPDCSLALGFMLGGIISPPDAVAATSVLHGLRVPRVAVAILEGESLVNDAASLIVFRFALAAVAAGSFVAVDFALEFFRVALGGVALGLAVALLVYRVHRLLPSVASVDASLTIMTPYIMYLAAEGLGCSGVLAVVAGGLFLSARADDFLSAPSKVQASFVWSTLVFLLNGFVFILIGLQLPRITEGLGPEQFAYATAYALAISLLTVVVRFVWVFAAAGALRWRRSRPAGAPDWKALVVIAWAGMRGVVSLASALAVPLTLADGVTAFPHRHLILFITFAVILVTLVLQGLSLPLVIRLLRFDAGDDARRARDTRLLQARLAAAALAHLDRTDPAAHPHPDLLARVRAHHTAALDASQSDLGADHDLRVRHHELLIDLVHAQRQALLYVRREDTVDPEVLRAAEDQLDMEEVRLHRAGP